MVEGPNQFLVISTIHSVGLHFDGWTVGSGLEVLKAENAEILLDLFLPLEIGDLIGLPHAVSLLAEKGFQVPANLIDFHPRINPATPESE